MNTLEYDLDENNILEFKLNDQMLSLNVCFSVNLHTQVDKENNKRKHTLTLNIRRA